LRKVHCIGYLFIAAVLALVVLELVVKRPVVQSSSVGIEAITGVVQRSSSVIASVWFDFVAVELS
jgi:hypothetical protein